MSHGPYARLRWAVFFAGAAAFLAGDFLTAGFFAAPRLLSSPRLFFNAAIRSMTLEPLLGLPSSGSWMIFSPFFFCFSAIRPLSAST